MNVFPHPFLPNLSFILRKNKNKGSSKSHISSCQWLSQSNASCSLPLAIKGWAGQEGILGLPASFPKPSSWKLLREYPLRIEQVHYVGKGEERGKRRQRDGRMGGHRGQGEHCILILNCLIRSIPLFHSFHLYLSLESDKNKCFGDRAVSLSWPFLMQFLSSQSFTRSCLLWLWQRQGTTGSL